ncbi:NXPE family member 1-like isoform X2 [Spea bombifrons]|uniref:NXPE family member 1-like isoform X2 n=1 Tax=Spea bombifrons TaxID=233779 RepID=UPI00234C01B6|nr:NXPE family member 1-like isoform X2 [Spea bombifrons]XP_053325970.1 NXPE family member 1-like isoform X2 [Spea bombifrons]XP_053325971.1 NXPE family member 1-like isoform X2 [Spea bombifrons]
MCRSNILRIIWVFSLVAILVLSFVVHRKLAKTSLKFPFVPLAYLEQKTSFVDSTAVHDSKDIHVKIDKILNAIDHTISNASFKCLNDTTSGKNSRATVLDYRLKYCTGDSLTVQVDMFDYMGKRKTYGGDFLRARIYSPELGAGASGRIQDFNNGTYKINFILSWEGNIRISIILLHPSEGVSALWKARNIGYKYIIYTGLFLNGTREVYSECGFYLDSQEEKCEYADKRDGEFFYCIKPTGVPCEALISMMSKNRPHSYLTSLEKDVFTRSNIGVEITTENGSIDVVKCQRNTTKVKSKCAIGMSPPFPGGYFLNNIWHSLFCNLSSYEPLYNIKTCLSGKMIYLMGDSTVRQWIEYFPKVMKDLKFFDLRGSGKLKTLLTVDMTRNVYIQWKKHGHPLVTQHLFTLKDYASVPREIDRLPGGPYTIIVIALGQHFRPFPLSLFIRRILSVREALERLFLRSPDTKVIIKSENTREITTDVERFSDFHGYIQYILMKDIFKGLNVGVIDAWDMTTAFGSYDVHPHETVIRNQINLFLAYIC